MRQRLTIAVVKTLPQGATAWDETVRGLCVRRRKSGAFYSVRYRHAGRQHWMSIGRHGSPWTPDTARTEALHLLGQVASGSNPADNRATAGRIPTVAQFAARYLTEHGDVRKKPSSAQEDRRNLANHILPELGEKRLDTLTRADVARFHHARSATPTSANRCRALISHMWNTAERWGVLEDAPNPCRHVKPFKTSGRERFLSEQEFARLGAALEGVEPTTRAALLLLVFTGCRKSEILRLRWDEVDLERGRLSLGDSKTGRRPVELNPPALQVLTGLPRIDGCEWVLTGRGTGPLANIDYAWRRVRAAAEIEDVHIHDLRHSFASVGAGAGQSLPIIGALLGHRVAATTQRYAHLSSDPLRKASADIGRRLEHALAGRAMGEHSDGKRTQIAAVRRQRSSPK